MNKVRSRHSSSKEKKKRKRRRRGGRKKVWKRSMKWMNLKTAALEGASCQERASFPKIIEKEKKSMLKQREESSLFFFLSPLLVLHFSRTIKNNNNNYNINRNKQKKSKITVSKEKKEKTNWKWKRMNACMTSFFSFFPSRFFFFFLFCWTPHFSSKTLGCFLQIE